MNLVILSGNLERARQATRLFLPFALSMFCFLSISSSPLRADPVSSNDWSYRFTSYTWLTGINGHQTVKGRTVDIDASFIDLAEHAKFPKDLFAIGGYFEARKGLVSLFSDIFYS